MMFMIYSTTNLYTEMFTIYVYNVVYSISEADLEMQLSQTSPDVHQLEGISLAYPTVYTIYYHKIQQLYMKSK